MSNNTKILLSIILSISIYLSESAFAFFISISDETKKLIVNLDMLEVCDNSIDDDGDGLIDAFDEDCSCGDLTADNLINNGDFESSTFCCFALAQKGICLNDWHLITASPDYYQLTCDPFDYALLDDAGIDYEGSLVGFGQGGVRTESIGTCLRSTLLSGQTYKLGIDLATMSNIVWELKEDFNIVVYGVKDCTALIDHDINLSFCESQLGADAVELFKVNMNSFPRNSMQKFEHQFILEEDIEAILIYGECGQVSLGNISAYFYMDNVEISPKASNFEYDSQIRTVGSICSSQFVEIMVDEQIDISYQWYKDSIPIPNAIQYNLIFNLNEVLDSEFHLLASSGFGCKLIGPFRFQGSHTEQVFKTICSGNEYVLGDTLLKTEGFYVRKTGVTSEGCDSIVQLDLRVTIPPEEKFTISPNLTASLGEEISIVVDEDFLNHLESYYWKKENSADRSFDPYFATVSHDVLSLPLRFYYVDKNGCEDYALFVLEWTALDSDTEICDNDIDDDDDGLVDVFDTDCSCMIKNDAAEYVITGNVCTEEIVIETPSVQSRLYQWYIDGDKMDIEVGNSLRINKNSSANKFHVALLDKDSCSLIGPIEIPEGSLSQIVNDTVCDGYTYDFFGRIISEPGPYQFVAKDDFGCLVNTTLNLSRQLSSFSSFTETICKGELYLFGNENLHEAGFYQDTLYGASSTGCDSIVSLTLSVDDVILVNLSDTICEGDQYPFGTEILLESGTYLDTIRSEAGCDSILALTLDVLAVDVDSISTTVFKGDAFDYRGASYNPGIYTLHVESEEKKCDRVLILTVLEDDGHDFYIPNVINPSSNSENCGFKIFSDREFIIKEIQIFDRWGSIVYSRKNFTIDDNNFILWDGMSNDQVVAQGIYSYMITIDGEDSVKRSLFKGQVLLLR